MLWKIYIKKCISSVRICLVTRNDARAELGAETHLQNFAPRIPITPQACISSATFCGISSRRSRGYHQAAGRYTLARDEIQPKGLMIYAALRASMIYQACGLDKKSDAFVSDFLCCVSDLDARRFCRWYTNPLAMMGAALDRYLPGRNAMLATKPM